MNEKYDEESPLPSPCEYASSTLVAHPAWAVASEKPADFSQTRVYLLKTILSPQPPNSPTPSRRSYLTRPTQTNRCCPPPRFRSAATIYGSTPLRPMHTISTNLTPMRTRRGARSAIIPHRTAKAYTTTLRVRVADQYAIRAGGTAMARTSMGNEWSEQTVMLHVSSSKFLYIIDIQLTFMSESVITLVQIYPIDHQTTMTGMSVCSISWDIAGHSPECK